MSNKASSNIVRVFVSSTWLDLGPERAALEAALQRMHDTKYNGMEYFGSRDESTRRASLDEVDRSDLYVGIFAGRYGSGITEAEYRRARKSKLPCFIYLKPDGDVRDEWREKESGAAKGLADFKDELRREQTITEFANPDALAAKVTADLHNWLAAERANLPALAAVLSLHQLPPPPADFVGREQEITELLSALERGGVTISGLQGMGGIGKTTLALKLAEQLKTRYPDAQFYLDLKGASAKPLTAAEALAHVLRAYHPTAKLPESEAELRGLFLSVLDGRRALLLMDNASDAAQVEPLIPPDSCALLVTSRKHFTLPGLFAKDLDTLPLEDARTLLLTIAPRIGDHANEIAEVCGCLPLALRLAASAIAKYANLRPSDYAARLKDAREQLKLIEASLRLSYELLTDELKKLWRMLAVFPHTFDEPAATAVWEADADSGRDSLSELFAASLVEWNEATIRYSLHDLARVFANDRLTDAERETARKLHAIHYKSVLVEVVGLYKNGGESSMQGLALFDLELANIHAGQAWAERSANEHADAAELCIGYPDAGIWILLFRQHPRERIKWLVPALAAARRLRRRSSEGAILGNLGEAYSVLGESRRAIELHEQSLVFLREIGDRRGEGAVLGNMGVAYADLGETKRAIEFYEQGLQIAREIGDRRGEGHALGNLGSAHWRLGETSRAIEFYQQRLQIAREIGDRRGEGNALGGMGIAYSVLGDTRRAIEFYEQHLAITREVGDRRGEGDALWNMSLAFDKLGERQKAVAHAEAALAIRVEIEDPRAAMVRKHLTIWKGGN
jgi:tetratricopeptide (TPR) repeat protein